MINIRAQTFDLQNTSSTTCREHSVHRIIVGTYTLLIRFDEFTKSQMFFFFGSRFIAEHFVTHLTYELLF